MNLTLYSVKKPKISINSCLQTLQIDEAYLKNNNYIAGKASSIYDRLTVDEIMSLAEHKFRQLVKVYHPDYCLDGAESFIRLTEAYERVKKILKYRGLRR